MKKLIIMAVVAMMAATTLTSCSKDDDEVVIIPTPEEPVVLNCAKPDFLKSGDKVALISPSYFTPMETIEKAAAVFRSWGFETVIGPNVYKVLDGKIGGTMEERVSDIRWALVDPSIKAIFSNRGGYGTSTMMRDLLLGKVPRYEVPAHEQNILGRASGVLVGGNLPLVMGAPVTIDVRSDGSTLQFDIDGEQQVVNTASL